MTWSIMNELYSSAVSELEEATNRVSLENGSCVRKELKGDYIIGWDDYFMALACLVSKRSKDPITQVGACIVNKYNRIVGQGYNGMPRGCSDDLFPWNKKSDDPLKNKFLYVCHAEMNAILNKISADLQGCTIYTALLPCNECSKMIIQSGISNVVYMSDKNMHQVKCRASIKMFDAAGVVYRQHIPKFRGVLINFLDCICEKLSYDGPDKCLFSTSSESRDLTKKRLDYLEWEEYFMAIAFMVSKRSKDPFQQLGSCIVNIQNRIVGQGYNGMPQGCSDDIFPWTPGNPELLEDKTLFECHAELNAILNSCANLSGCVMYTITFPCNECAKAIIQVGIKEIVYLRNSIKSLPEGASAQLMFDAAGVSCRQYHSKNTMLKVDFSEINWNMTRQLPPTPCEKKIIS